MEINLHRDPRPNSQLFANPPAQSMMAFEYFIFFQAIEVCDFFLAQLFSFATLLEIVFSFIFN